MIFYTAHGTNSKGFEGAWITYFNEVSPELGDSYVTLEEILEVIKQSGFKNFLCITSDSCFSGLLAKKAQTLWNSGVAKFLKKLKVECSCSSEKRCAWGKYRKMKKRRSKDYISEKQALEI